MKKTPLNRTADDDLHRPTEIPPGIAPDAAAAHHETDGRNLLHESQVHAVLDVSPDGCLLTGAGGKISFANRSAEALFGYTREELLALEIGALVPLRVRAGHQRLFDEFLHDPQPRTMDTKGEMGGVRKDASEFPAEVSLSPLWLNGEQVVIAVVRDMSELHSTQETMRIGREFFESTFVSAPAGMAIIDADGRYVKVNPALCKLVGYSEAELLTMSYMDIARPDELLANFSYKQAFLSKQLPSFQMRKRLIHKDGHEIWTLVAVSTVDDKDGKPLYTVAQMLDIDEQWRVEQALIEAQQQLRSLSAYQKGALEEERKHIVREMHGELGQLLSALKMDISLLRLRFGEDPALLERLESMRTLAERTIHVIRRVASDLRPAALDLGLAPAIEWLAKDFSQRCDISCNIDLSGDEVALDDVTATTVFRVVQESLTNVARHAQAGRAMISLRCDERLRLRVEDDGCGFDPAVVGTLPGLGLFGMRERILALGGTLKIASRPGGGTTLAIELPLSPCAVPARCEEA